MAVHLGEIPSSLLIAFSHVERSRLVSPLGRCCRALAKRRHGDIQVVVSLASLSKVSMAEQVDLAPVYIHCAKMHCASQSTNIRGAKSLDIYAYIV